MAGGEEGERDGGKERIKKAPHPDKKEKIEPKKGSYR